MRIVKSEEGFSVCQRMFHDLDELVVAFMEGTGFKPIKNKEKH